MIFKQQFSLFICITCSLYINILCSFSVQIKPVCFCSCVIQYFSLKNSIPIFTHVMVGETLVLSLELAFKTTLNEQDENLN